MANVPNIERLKSLIKEEVSETGIQFYGDYGEDVPPDESKEWVVVSWKKGYEYFSGKMPKKKPVTFEYLVSRINAQRSRTSVNNIKIFKKIPLNGSGGFHTSYGIGFSVLFGNNTENFKKMCASLDKMGIKYKTEYSEGRWVRRIKISQTKKNLAKINKIKFDMS